MMLPRREGDGSCVMIVGTAERHMGRLASVLNDCALPRSASMRGSASAATCRVGEYSERLLRELSDLGVDWTSAAPSELARRLSKRRRAARQFVAASALLPPGQDPVVWAHPSFCLLGQFWVEALDLSPTVILLYDEPQNGTDWLEHAASLAERSRRGLWERLNRAALSFCDEWGGIVVSTRALVEHPAAGCERIFKFVNSRAVLPSEATIPEVVAFSIDVEQPDRPGDAPEIDVVSSELFGALEHLSRLLGGLTTDDGRWLADRIGQPMERDQRLRDSNREFVDRDDARPARLARVAEWIVAHLSPHSVLDIGCGEGWLVEALRGRGVEARGIDASQAVISSLPGSLRRYCDAASVADELAGTFDLIVCADVLEHLPPSLAALSVANICRHAEAVLFSGSADGFEDPTLLNVRQPGYWACLFASCGFFRDFTEDASSLGSEAVLYRRRTAEPLVLIEDYEGMTWDARKMEAETNASLRDALANLGGERRQVAELRAQCHDAERAREEAARLLELERLRRTAEGVAHLDRMNAQERSQRALLTRAETAEELAEQMRAELIAVRQTKTFRYTQRLRRAYGLFRRHRPEAHVEPMGNTAPADGSYATWIDMYDTVDESVRSRLREELEGLVAPPLISVIMPVYDTEESHLREAVASVRRQLYPNWELCIADDGSSSQWIAPILDSLAREDDRVTVVHREVNGHISVASNAAFALAHGEWVALVDHDDVLPEHALAIAALAISRYPQAGMVYSDEDTLDDSGHRHPGYFKPDFDPLLLLGQNYLAHLCLIRRDLVDQVGGWRTGFEGSQDWDLVLRVSELLREDQVVHVPHVLYHWRVHPGSTAGRPDAKPYAAAAGQRAVAEHLRRLGREGDIVPVPMTGWNRVRWVLPKHPPKVSIIIPTRDSLLLPRCIESVRRLTTYPEVEIVVVDNGSMGVGPLEYLRQLEGVATVIRDEREFNFSALNNAAVRRSTGEVVCFLNDDTEVITDRWLDEMVGQLVQPGVGAVGAKLYYEDGRVQHGGILLGVNGLAAHSHRLYDRLSPGYFGRLVLPQRFSAVTAACMVVRREVWEQVGGLDEEHLGVAFNDVDFCLRLREAGWTVVWTPAAELFHHESVTRGEDAEEERHLAEVRYMKQRWTDVLFADPAYNPNLSIAGEPFTLAWPPRAAHRPAGR